LRPVNDSVSVVLHPHPNRHVGLRPEVRVDLSYDGRCLDLLYRVTPASRLRVPEAVLDPMRLWAHTCFEVFFAPGDGPAYIEWNVSPTGQTARFEFARYRERTRVVDDDTAVDIARRRDRLEVRARIELPTGWNRACLAPTAVLVDDAGTTTHWAVRHPAAEPDFHHRDGFTLSAMRTPVPSVGHGRR
jgi:hypothetical protein